MTDRPILFSAPMVRALLGGRKTQTRRVLEAYTPGMHLDRVGPTGWQFTGQGGLPRIPMRLKYAAGDRLWVREAFKPVHSADPALGARYRADVDRDQTIWKPGIHMPRWASRLTLPVTDVRVQRLQEINDDDAIAEGVDQNGATAGHDIDIDGGWWPGGPKRQYQRLWNHLNEARGFGWEMNPWVVAVTFTVERRNIDETAR
ncbi:hypothetical protein [Mesorhizobium sp. B2-4-6]|uniref:hypothetical protein n=1 Tax=Mesorhizobium sp. B2-4-6 TaxID=2589943 RepID=UPI00112A2B46|nr:hypothetical protein [Mesorhizobium sp. B2-4-6]TPL40636.1 hypothetical protein FJ957_25740 [Mesorhizobium sp. B2-4-6]